MTDSKKAESSSYEHILDNRRHSVADFLRAHLSYAEVYRLVSAYFTIYGYEALESELRGVRDVRFSVRRSCIRG